MPDIATVTAFYLMVARSKARATQANYNWALFRGHSIPIEADTAAASDNEHDLGATDHRWRNSYLGAAPYINGVQSNRFEIEDIYDGSSPTYLVAPLGELERISFPSGNESDVRFQFRVPPTYKPGQRISLTILGYPETTGAAVFYSTSRLYRMSVTAITASSTPAAVLTGTATIMNAVAGLVQEDSSMKLTDSSGLVNGATVTVGDLLTVGVKRATGATADTNTGQWFALGFMVNLND